MFSLNNIKFLIVDDNPADQFLCLENLTDQGADEKNIQSVSTILEMEKIVSKKDFDVILLDLFLPDSYGTNTFSQVKDLLHDKVVIVMSGYSEKNVALEAVNQGAQDFLIKGKFDNEILAKSISYSIERKKSILLLQKSEQKYKLLFEVSPLPLFMVELQSLKVEMANKVACDFFGQTNEEMIGKLLHDFFINYSGKEIIQKLSIGNIQGERFIYFKNNQKRIIRYYSNQFLENNIAKAVILYEDITEVVNFKKDKLKIIASIQDVERKKFAKELHDGLGQQLVLANLYLNQLENKSEHKQEINEIKKIVNTALEQSRSLTYNIMPPFLEDGIIVGLESLFNRLQKLENIEVTFNVNKLYREKISELVKSDMAYNIYRIAQEFINNSLKHAKASNIFCNIFIKNDKIIFQLKDNGIGFDTKTLSNGYGLKNFRERAEAFHLNLDLKSEPNKGTELSLAVRTNNLINDEKGLK